MLSICIPVYEYDIRELVRELHFQALKLEVDFEILVYDDHSPSVSYLKDNGEINSFEFVTFKVLERNLGRSAIRNKLAQDAQYPYILFLDADVYPHDDLFLQNYIDALKQETSIIYGGIEYQNVQPKDDQLLRWIYGREREALTVAERLKEPHLRLLTLNFLISKSTMQLLQFNENIPNLRHEDTLFALDAKSKNIPVIHIHNPVEHRGLESSSIFLEKSIESSQVLARMILNNLIDPQSTKLSRVGHKILSYRLSFIITKLQEWNKKKWERNLLSSKPSLKIFDLYRLCEYLKIVRSKS